MNPKLVLVPLDGSPLAEGALTTAMGFARNGAMLVLLRAVEAHGSPFLDPCDAQVAAIREAEDYLTAVAARLRQAGAGNVETTVWYGPPAASITDAARYRRAELIVMSSHGRSGLGRLVLGSVAESVLRTTYTPILLLRPGVPAPVSGPVVEETAHV